MPYVISQTSLWLSLSLALGLLVGWLSAGASDPRWTWNGWLKWAALIFTAALVLAIVRVVPGRAGFWIETGLLTFVAYLVGCLIGDLLRGLLRPAVLATPGARVAAPSSPAPARPSPRPGSMAPSAPAPVAASRPVPEAARMPAVADEEKYEGMRPEGYVSPKGGAADDLKIIRGIGPQNEARLHALGVWSFAQIADWSPDNVRWVGSYLAFPGRIDREDWVGQAKILAAGGKLSDTRH